MVDLAGGGLFTLRLSSSLSIAYRRDGLKSLHFSPHRHISDRPLLPAADTTSGAAS